MNLAELKAFLIENQADLAIPKCNYAFLGRVTLFNKKINADTPITGRVPAMQYKLMMKLVNKYLQPQPR